LVRLVARRWLNPDPAGQRPPKGGAEMSDDLQQTDPSLHGTVAIITGASRGIGAATARAFADAGAAVALAARSEHELTEVASAINASGGRAIAVPTDVG